MSSRAISDLGRTSGLTWRDYASTSGREHLTQCSVTWHSSSAVPPTESPSRSIRPKAKQRKLPANSSTKSAGESPLNQKAANALQRTLNLPPQLPLGSESTATPSEQRGRRQLKGAFSIELARI